MSAIDGLKFVSEDKFRNSEYYEQYGGDYNTYYQAFIASLKATPLFSNNFNLSIDNLNLDDVSLLATKPNKVTQYAVKTADEQQEIMKMLDSLPPDIREACIHDLAGGKPTRSFIDALITRHEKKQAKFEEVWAQYQESKDETQFYKGIYEVMSAKYEDSESNYEEGQVLKAEDKYSNSQLQTDLLLDNAGRISHSLFA